MNRARRTPQRETIHEQIPIIKLSPENYGDKVKLNPIKLVVFANMIAICLTTQP
uniref:Transposase n=1 Tax=Heterorhabditis bacteriophora TaxID=37862 RepID=A0A1I7XCG3_HETBA